MGDDPIATWKSKIKWYSESNHFKDMNRTDGMPTEFERKTFPGITTLGLLEKIQSLMRDLHYEPEHFMSMYNDIERRAKGNKERSEYNSQTNANYARKFPRGHLVEYDGKFLRIQSSNISSLSSAFERGELRSKEWGSKSIHFNGSHENIELLLHKVISANQLSIYGAVADLCSEEPKYIRAPGKPAAPDHLEKMDIPADLSIAENSTIAQQWRNLVQEYERKFEQVSEGQKSSKLCSDAGLKLVERGQYFHTLETEEGQ